MVKQRRTKTTKKKTAAALTSGGALWRSLVKVADDFDAHASSLQRAASTLRTAAHTLASSNGHAVRPMLKTALAMDAERRNNGHGHNAKRRPQQDARATRKRRQGTARVLAAYDQDTPKPWTHGGAGLGTLMRHGYLKRKGEGIVRTTRPYTV